MGGRFNKGGTIMSNHTGPGETVIIAYAAFTLYGILLGLGIGWLVWG